MEKHPYFDLLLHTSHELESFLGSRIIERQTLHEWPLSCVQLLALEDGRRRVYKTSYSPTVEAQFYAQARSRVLIPCETIYQDEYNACLLFEYLNASCLSACKMGESEALRIGQALQAEIGQVTGQFPVYMDISTWEGWQSQMVGMLIDLGNLVSKQIFRVVASLTIAKIEQTALSTTTRAVIEGPSSLVHNDLTDENIFLCEDGYRIIDWQRPIRGPVGLDLAILAKSLGYDPVNWVGPEIQRVRALLLIHWCTQCAVRWFPAGVEAYDRQIATLAEENL